MQNRLSHTFSFSTNSRRQTVHRLFCFVIPLVCCLFTSCKEKPEIVETPVYDWEQIKKRGEIVALMPYGATSIFDFHAQSMGYHYDLIRGFAADSNISVSIKIVPEGQLEKALLNEEGDVIAYGLPVINNPDNEISYTEQQNISQQVLIQRSGKSKLTSVLDLAGKEVYVLENTKYEQRLRNLNEEIGGGIIIKTVADSVGIDELIDRVSLGKYPFAVADEDIAQLHKIYLKNIDCSVAVSLTQRSAWGVRKNSPELLLILNEWFQHNTTKQFVAATRYNYFKRNEYFWDKKIIMFEPGKISPYDDLFKEYAKNIDWDWRLLTSLAYYESAFDPTVLSPKGATGLMQLIPQTAGLTQEELLDPERNLAASVEHIKTLTKIFSKVPDEEERIRFVLAAYNAGVGHVIDAMDLAEKNGYNRYIWTNNVDNYMRLKSNPEYYNDSVCSHGFCRGEDISDYVKNVYTRYQRYVGIGVK